MKSLWVFICRVLGRLSVHTGLAPPATPAKGVHSLGMQMPRDSPQKSLSKNRDFQLISSAVPAVQIHAQQFGVQGGEGRGSPGRGGARGWSTQCRSSLRHLPLSGLRWWEMRDRKGSSRGWCFPGWSPAGFHICVDVLTPHLQKRRRDARCYRSPVQHSGHQPRTPALGSGLAVTTVRAPAGW